MIHGILPVDKPAGWTSHDVVGRVRRLAGQRQVGHAGTLDPLATGVLVLVLGSATRLSPYLMESPKEYCAEIVLGVTTVTDDAEAPILNQRDIRCLGREDIESCLRHFVGTIDQIPPRYAAVRHDGQRLYKLARDGVTVQPRPRRVTIHDIQLLAWSPPRLRLAVRCGPGTYIRALARDIGDALEVGGYLHALRRIVSGGFTTASCVSMDELVAQGAVLKAVQPADIAVTHLPAVVLDAEGAAAVSAGRPVSLGVPATGTVRLYDRTGVLAALGMADGTRVKPFRVFQGGSMAHAHRQ